MTISKPLIRGAYLLLSLTISLSYALAHDTSVLAVAIGGLTAIGFTCFLYGLEKLFLGFNLRSLNVLILGLLFGYLLGNVILLTLQTIVPIQISSLFEAALFLSTTYFAVIFVASQSEMWHLSIPFIELKAINKRKDILLDVSLLSDPRLVDLANSGLLDQQLLVPRFALKDLQFQADQGDEATKNRIRKSFEVLKKLETIPELQLRYIEKDIPDCKEPFTQLIHLAQFLNANILSADVNKIQQAEHESIRFININFLSHALKPVASAGAQMSIKIQRYGKEPRQGVGYLEDGTMVVVNGGAAYIGETIKALVLSVKHTTTGRMIFCNAPDEEMPAHAIDLENSPRNYFAL